GAAVVRRRMCGGCSAADARRMFGGGCAGDVRRGRRSVREGRQPVREGARQLADSAAVSRTSLLRGARTFASTDSPLRITREPKSALRTSPPILTFRPRRAPRGTTLRLPTTVMPLFRRPGSCLFGGASYGPSPTIALWP